MDGFIKLHRKFIEWEWYTDNNVKILFLHLLLSVNHKDNKWRGQLIKKGSFITSYEKLAIATNLTIQQIRTALNKLKSTGEITYKSTSLNSIITINNWDEYQENNKQNNKQITNKQQTNNKRITTNKNDKNDKNNICAFFSEFYMAYPKKKSKQAAERAFNTAIKKVSFEKIMQGLKAYKEDIKKKQTQEQYIKYPATWLNQECWDDDYATTTKEEPFDYANTPWNPYR